ncbi:N-6 DNA methylase [uncultured Sphaerochaeta sp.]|uniref:N-6 DNA methylase n=1 Tax=uncultured Sphaerochaeta sp. TaxID=886478 RepID=UPI0026300B69|nr:N-6 DNA methylase [uncultured Sphaerochaeta sp.]
MKNDIMDIMIDASTYLRSLGIAHHPSAETMVGRLALVGEFRLNQGRGVIVRPKRGRVSARYLNILEAEKVDYVIVDGSSSLSIFGRLPNGSCLEPLCALPVENPSTFPSEEILQLFTKLFSKVSRNQAVVLQLASRIFVSKLTDEDSDTKIFTSSLITDSSRSLVKEFMGITEGFKISDKESLSGLLGMILALLAGYRVKPQSNNEVALLVEFLARLADKKTWGLSHKISIAMTGRWAAGNRIMAASAVPGVQLLPLLGASSGYAFLPSPFTVDNPLLRYLFPKTNFIDRDFLSWMPNTEAEAPDRLFVAPPIGFLVSATDLPNLFDFDKRNRSRSITRAPMEALYVEHALKLARPGALVVAVLPEGLLSNVGHAGFRKWVLEHSQLLAVLSLPPRTCSVETDIRCSIVYLKKTDNAPSDYPIVMLEAEEKDLSNPEVQNRLGKEISDALAGMEVGL